MSTLWYGVAQSARVNVRRHHSALTLSKVRGTTNDIRAIYGSTDYAKQDHRNDELCSVRTRVIRATDEPRIAKRYEHSGYSGRYAEYEVLTTSPESTKTVPANKITLESMLERAAHFNLTLVEYAQKIGVQL